MNDNMPQQVEIDLKDLICFVLKKIRVIVLVAVFFAVAAVGFFIVKGLSAHSKEDILNTEVRLEGETNDEYFKRVENIDRASEIMNHIDHLERQIEIQNEYIADTIYLQLDPLNTVTSKVQIIVACEEYTPAGVIDTIVYSYRYDINNGDYLDALAEALGYEPEQIRQMIYISIFSSSVSYIGPVSTLTMEVTVTGPTSDFTETVLDGIVEELESKAEELKSSIADHDLRIMDRETNVCYSDYAREYQADAYNAISSLQDQIDQDNTALDALAKTLGLSSRNEFYITSDNDAVSIISYFKYAVIGFMLGAIVVAGYFIIVYVFGRRIWSSAQFFCLFGRLCNIGVCKPKGNRSGYRTLLDRIAGDDNKLSEDNNNRIISNNYANLTSDMNKVLITGTADEDTAKKVISDLKLKGDVEINMFKNPEVLKDVAEYDGVVLVEQRGVSDKKLVREQIRLLGNSGKKIIGAILI